MNEPRNDIAVIGMAGAFPGAADIPRFWENLLAGREGIVDLDEAALQAAGVDPLLYSDPHYVRRCAATPVAKHFDAGFFGYSDAEAALMDPQHRVFLEHAWAALESACYIPDQVPGVVGIYAGCGFNRYLINKLSIDTSTFGIEDFQRMLASDKDFLATRVSYKLNLRGPSINVQTACSTSLVAVQMAVMSLQTFQCDIALAGGVTLNVPHGAGYRYTEGLIFSADGRCRPFTDKASGTVFGEGVGVVALKRLEEAEEDGDYILAVVRGAAVNNDGSDKVGYTAPSVNGQVDVISLAQELAGVSPADVEFVETHGTGTHLGDPIEIEGLREVFEGGGPVASRQCALGTLKANIGHLDAAAGIASFIKTVKVVQERKIPPAIHAADANPELIPEDSPFYLNEQIVDLSSKPRLVAGVSAFGVGGTNAHVVLESPPAAAAIPAVVSANCVVSARSEAAVHRYQQKVSEFAEARPEWKAALAHTLASARKLFNYRSWVQVGQGDTLAGIKTGGIFHALDNPKPAFMFAGQAMQFSGMARHLYETSDHYRVQLDRGFAICDELVDADLRQLLLEPRSDEADQKLSQTEISQPALFITEYALAATLMALGVIPEILIGHSLGEYVAACLSGVMPFDEALGLVCLRGKIMAKAEPSAMLSVLLPAEKLRPLMPDELEISLINSPENTVVSGSVEAIDTFKNRLLEEKIRCRRLQVSRAFHSRFMEPVMAEFGDAVAKVTLKQPSIPIVAMTTSYRGTEAPVWEADYWVKHLREPVDFDFGARSLLESGANLLVEIGPGSGLQSLLAAQPARDPLKVQSVSTILPEREQDPGRALADIQLDLWCSGWSIDLKQSGLVPEAPLIDAPTYPFEPDVHWLPDLQRNKAAARAESAAAAQVPVAEKIATCWRDIFGPAIADTDNFVDLGGDSLLGVQLANRLSRELGDTITIADIFAAPSISAMCERIDKGKDGQHFGLMFPIDSRGSGSPLFLIAGAHEDRYFVEGKSNYEEDVYRYFSTLVQHLGGIRPIMGFRPRGIFYGEEFHQSVEEMAAEYIQYLKQEQPEGPYVLGGECVGGIVAYEMARQLIAAGDEVKSLVLMDTHFPSPWFRFTETSRVKLRRVKKQLVYLAGLLKKGDVKRFGRDLWSSVYSSLVYLFPVTKALRHRRNAVFGSQLYLDLLLCYQPVPLDIPVHLLVNKDWWNQNPTMGWHQMQTDNISIQPVPGDHRSRLTTHGDALGNLINGLIQ